MEPHKDTLHFVVLLAVLGVVSSGRHGRDEVEMPDILIHNVQVQLTSPESQGDQELDSSSVESEEVEWDFPGFDDVGPDLAAARSGDSQSPIEGLSMGELEELIEGFGLEEASSSGGRHAMRFMLEMYRRLQEGEELPQAAGYTTVDAAILRADTVRSLPASESHQEKHRANKVTLTFNLTSISSRETTERAELRIRPLRNKRRDASATEAQFRAKVSIFSNNVRVQRLTYHVKAEKQTTDGFAVLDLTPLVRAAVEAGYGNATMEINLKQLSARRDVSRQRRSAPRTLDLSSVTKDAMLVVFTKDKHFFENFREKATKRYMQNMLSTSASKTIRDMSQLFQVESKHSRRNKRASSRKGKSDRDLCDKTDLMIDFNQIGWGEWIIYPKKFNAYQCSGKCTSPVSHKYDPTNHALLQSLMRIRDGGVTPRPCCVPTKLRPMSMLYIEGDEMVVRRHKDMVVDKCGCR